MAFPTQINEVRYIGEDQYLIFGELSWMIAIYDSNIASLRILEVPGPYMTHKRILHCRLNRIKKELEVIRYLKFEGAINSDHIWQLKINLT